MKPMAPVKLITFVGLFLICTIANYVHAGGSKIASIFGLLEMDVKSGREIITSGYMVNTSDGLYLYPYQIDAENGDFTREIFVSLGKDKLSSVLKHCEKKFVLIEGRLYGGEKYRKQISDIVTIYKLPKRGCK